MLVRFNQTQDRSQAEGGWQLRGLAEEFYRRKAETGPFMSIQHLRLLVPGLLGEMAVSAQRDQQCYGDNSRETNIKYLLNIIEAQISESFLIKEESSGD